MAGMNRSSCLRFWCVRVGYQTLRTQESLLNLGTFSPFFVPGHYSSFSSLIRSHFFLEAFCACYSFCHLLISTRTPPLSIVDHSVLVWVLASWNTVRGKRMKCFFSVFSLLWVTFSVNGCVLPLTVTSIGYPFLTPPFTRVVKLFSLFPPFRRRGSNYLLFSIFSGVFVDSLNSVYISVSDPSSMCFFFFSPELYFISCQDPNYVSSLTL